MNGILWRSPPDASPKIPHPEASRPAQNATIKVSPLTAEEVAALPLESAIGHADTAKVVSGLLGIDLPANRVNISLNPGDKLVVAQYIGPRLPEGATQLPDGARIEFRLVKVEEAAYRQITISTIEECVLRCLWSQLPEMRRRDECLSVDDWNRLDAFLAREIGEVA